MWWLLARSVCLLATSIFIFISPEFSNAADRDVLLQIAPLSNYTLVGWNSSNPESICTWQGVGCDAEQRVTSLSLAGRDETNGNILTGSLPQSIALLDRLQSLSLGNNFIYGDFPSSIFSLPNIRSVFIRETGLTVSFPATVSDTMTDIIATKAKVVSPIPEARWDQMKNFDLEATGLNCPFPPGLVAHFNSGKNLSECFLALNNLTIDRNNMVCGQIHISKLTCSVSPLAHKAPYFPNDDTMQVKNFTARLGNFTLEFTEDEVMIFQTYRIRSGARKEYRGEYVSFRLMPIGETYGPEGQRRFATLERPFWANFVLETNRVRANSTNASGIVSEFIFDLTISDEGFGFVKISNYFYNLGHQWIPSPGRTRKVSLFYVFNFRMTHSKGSDSMECGRNVLTFSTCNSTFASAESGTDFSTGLTGIRFRTPTVQIEYEYGLVGTIDGAPLSGAGTIIATRMPLPLPSNRWLEANRAAGARISTNASDSEQSFAAPIELFVPEFRDKLFYDPDISITLLFDPEDRLPPEATDNGVNVATPVGLIVGIVIVVVVIIAGVTLYVTVIFPYWKARQAVPDELEEAKGDSSPPTTGWTKANTPSAST